MKTEEVSSSDIFDYSFVYQGSKDLNIIDFSITHCRKWTRSM
jgi:hypothetical protein